MRQILPVLAVFALAACSQPSDEANNTPAPQTNAAPETAEASSTPAPDPIAPVKADVPSGAYTLDPSHASLTFRVSHLGFSNYTARFARFEVQLQLDTANPAASSVTATIDPNSLELNAPPPGFLDQLRGAEWLDTAQFPQMTFRSTQVELTGANTARITGDFTMHGQTHPVTLDATFNGGYPGIEGMDPNARIGFSAHGTLNRSEFGMGYGVPAPGSTMGVSDAVEIIIEAEFTGPPLAAAGPAQ